jgi:hypothetical protein
MKETVRRKRATICLMIAMFFNPFGMDVLTKTLLDLGISYWRVIASYYLLAGLFFGLFFFFSKINPIQHLINKIKNIVTGRIKE